MKKNYTLTFLLSLLFSNMLWAQVPEIEWDRTFGGKSLENPYATVQTKDGGFLVGGTSSSLANGDKTAPQNGNGDFWIVKTDSAGNKEWDKAYGGDRNEMLTTIVPASNGGYLLAGTSRSGIGGDKTDTSRGDVDVWVVKIDEKGNLEWDETFGGTEYEEVASVVVSSEGHYLLAGSTSSSKSGEVSTEPFGSYDYWLLKINVDGDILWEQRFGGKEADALMEVQKTSDGGYLLAGSSESAASGIKESAANGANDFWLVKTDKNGNLEWDKAFGGDGQEVLRNMVPAGDGGFVLAGYSDSDATGDKTGASKGEFDLWIVKVDADGNKVWDKSFGGNSGDGNPDICPAHDGGYLIAADSESGASGDKSDVSLGLADLWVLKISENGDLEWEKSFGGSEPDRLKTLLATKDFGYLLTAFSWSDASGDKTQELRGTGDFWMVKLAPSFTIWENNYWTSLPNGRKDAIVREDLLLNSDLKVKSLTVEANADFVVKEGSVTINGDLLNNGSFTVSNNGSVLMNDTSEQTGRVVVQKNGHMEPKYNYIGSPVVEGKVSALGNYAYSYDESFPFGESRWLEAPEIMEPGKGYTSFQTGFTAFSGILNNGEVPVEINRTSVDNNAIEGWNLVANPYPSAINVNDFLAENSGVINGFVYVWDESGKDGYKYSNGDYLVSDGVVTVGGNGGQIFNNNISSCQAFFIQKSEEGQGSLTFNNAMRVEGSSGMLLRKSAPSYPYLKIKAQSAGGQINDLLVKFTQEAKAGKDASDAYHLKGNPQLAFYSKVEGEDYIINALPQNYPAEVQLGLDLGAQDAYTFSLTEAVNLEGKEVYLEDLEKDSLINLKQQSYTLDLSAASDLQRFKLHVTNGKVLSAKAPSVNGITVYSTSNGTLFIKDTQSRTKQVQIVDLTGREVENASIKGAGTTTMSLPAKPGIYVVKVNTGDEVVSEKVQVF